MRRRRPHGKGSFETGYVEPAFFMPAYSVTRAVSGQDPRPKPLMRAVRESLDRSFATISPSRMCLTGIDKALFVERMRAARVYPDAMAMLDLARSTQQGLRQVLGDSPPGLKLPLGRLERFGPRLNQLGISVLGWRGYRANYALHDTEGALLPLGSFAAEQHVSLGVIGSAMAEHNPKFTIDGLAATPYIPLASRPRPISLQELHAIEDRIAGKLPDKLTFDELELNDPVIRLSLNPGPQGITVLPVRELGQPVPAPDPDIAR